MYRPALLAYQWFPGSNGIKLWNPALLPLIPEDVPAAPVNRVYGVSRIQGAGRQP